jgi:hypothetical protein
MTTLILRAPQFNFTSFDAFPNNFATNSSGFYSAPSFTMAWYGTNLNYNAGLNLPVSGTLNQLIYTYNSVNSNTNYEVTGASFTMTSSFLSDPLFNSLAVPMLLNSSSVIDIFGTTGNDFFVWYAGPKNTTTVIHGTGINETLNLSQKFNNYIFSNYNSIAGTVTITSISGGVTASLIDIQSLVFADQTVQFSDLGFYSKSLNKTQNIITNDPINLIKESIKVQDNYAHESLNISEFSNLNNLESNSSINTKYIDAPSTNISIQISKNTLTISDILAVQEAQTLSNIQRLTFSDGVSIATDMQPDEHGYLAFALTITCFGENNFNNYYSQILDLFDGGKSLSQITQVIEQKKLIETFYNIPIVNTASPNKVWVDQIYYNVFNCLPSLSTELTLINDLINEECTRAELLFEAINDVESGIGSIESEIKASGVLEHGLHFIPTV